MAKGTGQFGIYRNYTHGSSKTYCLPHDLLIAELVSYGPDKSSLRLLMDYLNSHKQRTRVGSSYSGWSEIKRNLMKLISN